MQRIESLWRLVEAVEDMAYRNERDGKPATELRRLAVVLGESAIELTRETDKCATSSTK